MPEEEAMQSNISAYASTASLSCLRLQWPDILRAAAHALSFCRIDVEVTHAGRMPCQSGRLICLRQGSSCDSQSAQTWPASPPSRFLSATAPKVCPCEAMSCFCSLHQTAAG